MSNNAFDSLAGLRTSTEQLNKSADHLIGLVLGIEQFLSEESNVGTPVYVPTPSPKDSSVHYLLGYQRYDKKFRIVVKKIITNPLGIDDVIKPWAECTRDVKIKTAKCLTQLISEIYEVIQSEFDELQEARKVAAAVLISLTDKGSK